MKQIIETYLDNEIVRRLILPVGGDVSLGPIKLTTEMILSREKQKFKKINRVMTIKKRYLPTVT